MQGRYRGGAPAPRRGEDRRRGEAHQLRSYISPTSRLHLAYISSISRLHLVHISPTSARLLLLGGEQRDLERGALRRVRLLGRCRGDVGEM